MALNLVKSTHDFFAFSLYTKVLPQLLLYIYYNYTQVFAITQSVLKSAVLFAVSTIFFLVYEKI